ncbi:MAG: HlyD family efflux transporter periplasmic adaptor subunit [Crocinitomicaceae bacterium]|nr:MAG: HlyD family efflux transporter periplasmic adaptor subunit [Crocinitomicaceae bacterium]
MKKNQLILIGVFVLITAAIFMRVKLNKKDVVKETKSAQTTLYVPTSKVSNQLNQIELISYGQITPSMEVDLSFEVQGRLEKGDIQLKPGVKFKMNQLLYKVNQEEAFYSLSSRKVQLANLVIGIMADIELDFPSEKNKWVTFMDNLKPENRLPALPTMRSQKERMFITSRGIMTEYYSIRSMESRMEKYFLLAPFSGTVLEIYAEPGSIANPGGKIARVAKTGDFEVKVPISLSTIKLFQQKGTASFTDATGKTIGTGKIIRISDVINQKTQSVDVYYSIQSSSKEMIFNGQFVNVEINQTAAQESFIIPRNAVKGTKVHVIENKKLVQKEIMIVGSKPDSVYVSGLKNGEEVVLEQIEVSSSIKEYKGIKR